jgi:hypothetical protein
MSISTKKQIVLRLKEELDAALRLVVHVRESLENELATEWAQKKLAVDKSFLSKLKELASAFNSLTDSKVRLDKAERMMEEDLTPAEELEAVRGYLLAMEPIELRSLVASVRLERAGFPVDD